MTDKKLRYEQSVSFDENRKLHAIERPAIQYDTGDATYYKHGKMHRLDGPAVDWPSRNYFVYYIDGVEYAEEDFSRIIKTLKAFL